MLFRRLWGRLVFNAELRPIKASSDLCFTPQHLYQNANKAFHHGYVRATGLIILGMKLESAESRNNRFQAGVTTADTVFRRKSHHIHGTWWCLVFLKLFTVLGSVITSNSIEWQILTFNSSVVLVLPLAFLWLFLKCPRLHIRHQMEVFW